MFSDHLAYRTASHGVQAFVEVANELTQRRQQAAELLECESYLQLGIDAFHWLMRADEHYRKAVFSEQLAYDNNFDAAFDTLCAAWLKPTPDAEEWLASLASRGFAPPNAVEFRDCVVEMRAMLAESNVVSGELAALRDQAIDAYKAGKTDEWRI